MPTYEVESNDAKEQANGIALATTVFGNLASLNDVDYYTFALTEFGNVSFSLTAPAGPTVLFRAAIYDSADLLLGRTAALTGASRLIQIGGLKAGTYRVGISSSVSPNDENNSGQYSFSVNAAAADSANFEVEPNGDPAAATSLAVGGTLNATLFFGDVDCYAVSVAAGGGLELTVDTQYSQDNTYRSISILNAAGATLMSSTGWQHLRTYRVGVSDPGTYYVKIDGYEQAYSIGLAFTAGSCAGYALDTNDSRESADALELGSVVTGQIASELDVDYYAVSVPGSGSLQLGWKNGFASLAVVDADGVVMPNYDFSSSPRQIYLPAAGTYYIRAAGYRHAEPYSFSATFAAGHLGFESESNDTLQSADEIVLGESMGGSIGSDSDVDYFAVSVGEGGVLRLVLDPDFMVEPFSLRVLDVGGRLMAASKRSFAKLGIDVGLDVAGTYYIGIEGGYFPVLVSQYRLGASFAPGGLETHETESNDTRDEADTLTLGVALDGQLSSAADIDFFAITVPAEGVLTVACSSWVVRVQDDAGTQLAYMSQSGSVGVGAAGSYYVIVENRSSFFPGEERYSLSASFAAGTSAGYESEGNDSRATADTLALGESINGRCGSLYADVDYFSVTVGQRGILTLELDPDRYMLAQYQVQVESGDGGLLTTFGDFRNSRMVSAVLPDAGTYYVRVAGVDEYTLTAAFSANHSPAGSVSLLGNPYVGQILRATNDISDVDGVCPISYAWQKSEDGLNWTAVDHDARSDGPNLLLYEQLLGQQIRVVAKYDDRAGYPEMVVSAGVRVETAAPPPPPEPVVTKSVATPTDNAVALSGNPAIDGLVQGSAWRFGDIPHIITYSLSLNDNPNGGAWGAGLRDAVRGALTRWSDIADIVFVEYDSGTVYSQSHADIAIMLTGNEMRDPASGKEIVGFGIFPSPAFADALIAAAGETRATVGSPEGDIAFDNYHWIYSYLDAGGIGFWSILHEIGHAIGLKHPFDDGGNGRPTFADGGIADLDASRNTVMSYGDIFGAVGGDSNTGDYPTTPMVLDVLAIQAIYGANVAYHVGDDTYDFSDRSPRTIWDAGGIDTLDAGGGYATGYSATLDLRQGHYSESANRVVAISYETFIENAIGGNGIDKLIGNAAANRLDGGGGDDSMTGGAGDDTYIVDVGSDAVVEYADEGTDTVVASIAFSLPDNVENLSLSGEGDIAGTGNGENNGLTGNNAANTLVGGGGNDTLDGGGGMDSMAGGAGDDVYMVADTAAGRPNSLQLVGLPGNWYLDGAVSSISLAPLPSVVLMDRTGDGLIDYIRFDSPATAVPFDLAIGSDGDAGANLAVGSCSHLLRLASPGASPAGIDFGYDGRGLESLVGAFTIDAMSIDYGGDAPVLRELALRFEINSTLSGILNYKSVGAAIPELVVEQTNEGTDEVRASVSYRLPANVEYLTLTGVLPLAGYGNVLANRLVANDAGDTMEGGAGVDTLSGGAGNDLLDGGAGGDILAGGVGDDIFRYVAKTNSTLAATDRIADFTGTDKIDFVGMGGISLRAGNYAYGTSVAATVDAIRADAGVVDAIVGFSNGASEYLYVKGTGNGVDFDGTLIELAANVQAPTVASFQFSPGRSAGVQAYAWKSHALLGNVAVTPNDSTDSDGSASIGGIGGTTLTLAPQLDVDASAAAAIELQDAIAILKLIVGLDVNGAGRPLSPY
ncbi:MAG: M10 family metallopeptidase C-terminal domain-containing protein, partial [Rhodocyclales bacterium]|nr:M10 family metallopeptidase C-terminal domain-containing protein [Rhodocyclales bacterium]